MTHLIEFPTRTNLFTADEATLLPSPNLTKDRVIPRSHLQTYLYQLTTPGTVRIGLDRK